MRLLLSVARRRASNPFPNWICQSCRAFSNEFLIEGRGPKHTRKSGPARTRFAPSPTGYLHMGSLRTALYNYMLAKATGGQFILRIEDTDQSRTVPDAEERLYEDLRWAGIEWDEGPNLPNEGPYGPYKQSQRLKVYQEAAHRLMESDDAYRCFCTPERLEELAKLKKQLGLRIAYDRHCYHISKAESEERAANKEKHVIRLAAPDRYPQVYDVVHGKVKVHRSVTEHNIADGFEDPILLKTDGFPTYHLANVIDDHLMGITDVVRGSEWMSSTPKHLQLYKAFGWEPPNFAHVSLLVDKEQKKLSKRGGSIDIRTFRREGYFPVALNNFVALCGWSHKVGRDVMTMRDLILNASMKYTRGNTVVAFDKLRFLQRKHTVRYAALEPTKLLDLAVRPIVKSLDHRCEGEDFSLYGSYREGTPREEYIFKILMADSHNYYNPQDFIERNIYFLVPPSSKMLAENLPEFKIGDVSILESDPNFFHSKESLLDVEVEDWTESVLRKRIFWMVGQGEMGSPMKGMEAEEVKRVWSRLVHEYLRWALNGGKAGTDIAAMMAIIGREQTLKRFRKADAVLSGKLNEMTVEGIHTQGGDL